MVESTPPARKAGKDTVQRRAEKLIAVEIYSYCKASEDDTRHRIMIDDNVAGGIKPPQDSGGRRHSKQHRRRPKMSDLPMMRLYLRDNGLG